MPVRLAGTRGEKLGSSIVAHRFGQKVRIIIVRIRSDRPLEELCHVLPRLVNGEHSNMTRWLSIELLNPFTEIGLRHLDPAVLEERRHSAFLVNSILQDHGVKEGTDGLVAIQEPKTPALSTVSLRIFGHLTRDAWHERSSWFSGFRHWA
jgi:hypothetical protein